MKKITLLLSFFLFVALGLSAQTLTEDFEGTYNNLTGSYATSSFTNPTSNIEWSYAESRDEGSYAINNSKGLMLRRPSDSYLEATFPNGVGTFTFDYRKAFTGAAGRKLELLVNGTSTVVTPEFGAGSGEDATVHPFTYDVNVSGSVTIKIKPEGTTSSNRQITIDNITWTEYAGTTDPTITVTSPEAGDSWEHGSNHNITWTYANIASTATVNINLYKNDVLTESLATGVTINAGSWTWNNISSSILAGSDYTIKIEEATSPATGTSGVFSITAPIPVVNITAPIGGANWLQGTTETITWTYANIADNTLIDVHYTTDATNAQPQDWQTVATGIEISSGSGQPLSGSVQWNIPANLLASNDCQIRITPTGIDPFYSGKFNLIGVSNIAALRAGTLNSTYKLTGEAVVTYMPGQRNQKYVQDATGTQIAGILIDDPSGVITATYNVGDGITGLTGTLSNYFGTLQFTPVADPGAPSSTGNVITPEVVTIAQLADPNNFGAYQSKLIKLENVSFQTTGNFVKNTVYDISDNNTPPGTFGFRTSFSNANYIGTAIPTATMDMVAIPTTRDYTNNYVTSRSTDDFIITSTYFTVTAPAAGDSWQQGTTHAITWDYANIAATSVDILLYKGGVYSKDLKLNEPIGNKSWNWNIPADQTIGNDYTVVIAAGGTTEYSSGQFSIIAPIPVPKIFISEYIEGSSQNKAIEIYNGTGGTIDLSKLTIKQYNSGQQGQVYTLNNLTGNLTAGDVYTICHSSANEYIKSYSDHENGSVMSFNGDDALVIIYDGVVCDVFGDTTTKPPTSGPWTVGDGTTENNTLLYCVNLI